MARIIEALNEVYVRKTALTVPQSPIDVGVPTIVFNNDHAVHLELVEARQRKFDEGLGVKRKRGEAISYNPVLDRANVELVKTDEELQAVKSDMDKELKTNLRERYCTAKSIVKYFLDDHGRVFSEDDHNEPVDVKFQRGALYRIQEGSPEPEREQQTVLAGVMAKSRLAYPGTAIGSKVIVISPPGVVKNTAYNYNFVNIYELGLDPKTGNKIIWMTCFASSCSSGDYKEVITCLKPGHSDSKDKAFDVWCLENPIFIDSRLDTRDIDKIFNQEFKPQERVIKEDDSQEILRRTFSVRQNYIDMISGRVFEPTEVAESFNAVVNKADAIKREIISRGEEIIGGVLNFAVKAVRVFENIKEEVKWWGRQVVEKAMGGCGMSGGFSIVGKGILNLVSGVLEKVSGVFSGSDQYGSLEFQCPKCKQTNRRPKGQLIPNCQHCNANVRC